MVMLESEELDRKYTEKLIDDLIIIPLSTYLKNHNRYYSNHHQIKFCQENPVVELVVYLKNMECSSYYTFNRIIMNDVDLLFKDHLTNFLSKIISFTKKQIIFNLDENSNPEKFENNNAISIIIQSRKVITSNHLISSFSMPIFSAKQKEIDSDDSVTRLNPKPPNIFDTRWI